MTENKGKKIKSSMSKKKVYDKNSITVIRDDIPRLRERFESYIGYNGTMAALHLLKEVLQNSIDEAGDENSPCNEIFIDYNQKEGIYRVKDNGRGIPIEKIVDLATVLQSSGKFRKKNDLSRTAYKFSAGINGVGLTASNALSHMCRIVVCRDGVKWECLFSEGYVISDKKLEKSDETSTDVTFQPSEDVLGPINLDPSRVLALAEDMANLSKVKIKVHITPKGKDGDINKTFKSNGIVDALIKLVGDKKHMIIDPIYFRKEIDDKRVEVAMTYVNNATNENILSYANYCTTIEHGTHVTGVKTGLTRTLTRYIKNIILTAKEKLNITGDDCRSGWVCIINADHLVSEFVGQVKERINNEDLVPFCANTTAEALKSWIDSNPKQAKTIGMMIRKVAKLREDGHKARTNVVAKVANVFSIDERKYVRATGKEDLELIILEGESCVGTAKLARDKTFQELYAVKGVPANTYGFKQMDVRNNKELRDLETIMECGMGDKCDHTKSRHERIIIGTDADADGFKITSILSMHLLVHMSDMVRAGKVYKLLPPLYGITGGKKINGSEYIDSKKDLNDIIKNEMSLNNTIHDSEGKKLSSKKLLEILQVNTEYYRGLNRLGNKICADPLLLEFTLINREDKPTVLCKKISKRFIHLKAKVDKSNRIIVEGVFNKEFQYVIIDDRLFNKSKDIIKLIELNRATLYGLDFKLNDKEVTLYGLLKEASKYKINTTRFKGLGEMKPKQLWHSALNPLNRRLIRLTISDLEKDIENFAILHSDKKKDIQARAKMFESFKIDRDDIDN